MSEEKNTGNGEKTILDDIEQVSKHFRRSVRTVYRWQKQGMPVLPDGRFDVAAIDAWRCVKKGMDPGLTIEAGDGAKQDGDEQQIRAGKDYWDAENKQYQAKMRALDYKARKGELIKRKKVEDEFVARVYAVKQSLLALERSLPPDLVACRSEREMSAVIHKAVRDILEGFSRPLPPDLQPPPADDAGQPPPGEMLE